MIFRIIITLILIYFSYLETGWATAACLFLIFLSLEGTGIVFRQLKIRLE